MVVYNGRVRLEIECCNTFGTSFYRFCVHAHRLHGWHHTFRSRPPIAFAVTTSLLLRPTGRILYPASKPWVPAYRLYLDIEYRVRVNLRYPKKAFIYWAQRTRAWRSAGWRYYREGYNLWISNRLLCIVAWSCFQHVWILLVWSIGNGATSFQYNYFSRRPGSQDVSLGHSASSCNEKITSKS